MYGCIGTSLRPALVFDLVIPKYGIAALRCIELTNKVASSSTRAPVWAESGVPQLQTHGHDNV